MSRFVTGCVRTCDQWIYSVPELKTRLLMGLFVAAFLSGCWWAKGSDLPGHYVADFDWGQSVLELESDGSFTEDATDKRGTKKHLAGKWEYHNHDVVLTPCLRLEESGVADKPFGYCTYPVEGYGTAHV